MNPSNEDQEPASLDELHDRLIDNSLRELVGNESPPDLSARLLAANAPAQVVDAASGSTELATGRAAPVEPRTRKRAFWAALAVAAMLLIGITFAILPSVQVARKAAKVDRLGSEFRSSTSSARSKVFTSGASTPGESSEVKADSRLPSPYYLADDVQHLTIAPTSSEAWPPAGRYAINGRDKAQSDAPTTLGASSPKAKVIEGRVSQLAAAKARYGEADVRLQSSANEHKREPAPATVTPPGFKQLQAPQNAGLQGLINDAHSPIGGNFSPLTDEGIGPGQPGDQYSRIFENRFIQAVGGEAVSTFSIDVDTASYANVRQFLLEMNTLPPPDAVRIEELVNYFDYDYAPPPADAKDSEDSPAAPGSAGGSNAEPASAPFAAHVEVAGCPWAADHRLVRIGIKGREMDRDKRPKSNLVFLVDVSGSMNQPNKLPLVVYGLRQLTRELGENDRVAIVVYASSEGLVLSSTPGSEQATILSALGRLQAGGSTAGAAGIHLAYQIAEDNFIEGGTNRVILCTDGDFNVGVTSVAELERLCEQKAKDTGVFLSVLGFGRGNLNDAMMEAISNRGNGNYHYVDNRTEARRVLVEEMTGTLVTIAKDVKIQVEFNPRQVAGYRLIGYENRMLRTEDFNDDTKDAGEIGAGHTVTALYEVVPAGKPIDIAPVDDLKYQQPSESLTGHGDEEADIAGELLTLKMRYKQPDGDTSRKLDWAVKDEGKGFGQATTDYQFAAAVAGFGLLLRDSQYKGNLSYAAVLELAQAGIGADEQGYRAEFIEMVRRAKSLRGE